MPQGLLPFYYELEKAKKPLTAFAGLPLYLDLAHAAKLRHAIETHVKARTGEQGYTDAQCVLGLVLLNLAGGESVDDLRILEQDAGLAQLIRHVEWTGKSREERRALERRWRKEQTQVLPSPTTMFRFLEAFHVPELDTKRQAAAEAGEKAFIPEAPAPLKGLYQVNALLLEFAQKASPQSTATLDMDATLVETGKKEALFCYKGFGSYQPMNTYWVEQGLMPYSEFRDGNVPAGYQQLRVLKKTLALLPQGVERVNLRSDTAGYQWELLKYCAEGKNERFGVIRFVVGVDVTPEFKKAVIQVPEADWKPLERKLGAPKQEWAEVVFVPNAIGGSKNGPDYRFLAIREVLPEEPTLPGIPAAEQQELPFPTIELSKGTQKWRYKLHGIVTNDLEGSGPELIQWYRDRCGKSEEAHYIMKEELAGGRLPSGDFGENAAWWAIMILALNLFQLMNRQVLGGRWATKRLKAVRFGLIGLAGRVMTKARQLRIRVEAAEETFALLLRAREKIALLAGGGGF